MSLHQILDFPDCPVDRLEMKMKTMREPLNYFHTFVAHHIYFPLDVRKAGGRGTDLGVLAMGRGNVYNYIVAWHGIHCPELQKRSSSLQKRTQAGQKHVFSGGKLCFEQLVKYHSLKTTALDE